MVYAYLQEKGKCMKREIVIFIILLLRKLLRIFDVFHVVDENKSLFIRIDHLGDVVCSLPAVEEYLNANKTHSADLLISSPNAALFIDLSLPFKILHYREKTLLDLLKLIFLIRKNCYKNIYILHTTSSARNVVPTILSTKSIINGLAFDSIFYNACLDKKTILPYSASENNFRFEGSIVFDLVKKTDLGYEPPYPNIFNQLAFHNNNKPAIGFFTTVYNHEERRMWSVEKFALLADMLIEKFNTEILLFGGPTDYNYNEMILKVSKYPLSIKNISGKYPLSKIPSIINSLSLVVCVAAGLMHIAMTLQKEMIILLGPTPMERWVRKKYFKDCIRAGLECQPCERKIAGQCLNGTFECMRKIEVDEVFCKAEEKLTSAIEMMN